MTHYVTDVCNDIHNDTVSCNRVLKQDSFTIIVLLCVLVVLFDEHL